MVSHGDQPRVEAGDELRRLVSELRPPPDRGLVITVDGEEVARLIPFADAETPAARPIEDTIRDIEKFGDEHSLDGLSWKDLRDEGRRA